MLQNGTYSSCCDLFDLVVVVALSYEADEGLVVLQSMLKTQDSKHCRFSGESMDNEAVEGVEWVSRSL